METPDELLARLDRMGEERVRALLCKKYFEPRTIPLVEGWVSRKEQERAGNGGRIPPRDFGAAIEKARTLAGRASEAAARATETASKSQRLAIVAVAAGSAALLISILALFAMAIR
jgi:uncharacterized MAPEG superfamily protein